MKVSSCQLPVRLVLSKTQIKALTTNDGLLAIEL